MALSKALNVSVPSFLLVEAGDTIASLEGLASPCPLSEWAVNEEAWVVEVRAQIRSKETNLTAGRGVMSLSR